VTILQRLKTVHQSKSSRTEAVDNPGIAGGYANGISGEPCFSSGFFVTPPVDEKPL
jgi:hypothetical protein